MDYNVIISIDAENDTNEAYTFYEKKQQGLGERFLQELSIFYNKIQQHPTHY